MRHLAGRVPCYRTASESVWDGTADVCVAWLACRGRYLAYKKAGYMQPFHTRRAPYKVKLYHFDGYVIKEYSGAVEKVRCARPSLGLCHACQLPAGPLQLQPSLTRAASLCLLPGQEGAGHLGPAAAPQHRDLQLCSV
jgi:hypothetical protein